MTETVSYTAEIVQAQALRKGDRFRLTPDGRFMGVTGRYVRQDEQIALRVVLDEGLQGYTEILEPEREVEHLVEMHIIIRYEPRKPARAPSPEDKTFTVERNHRWQVQARTSDEAMDLILGHEEPGNETWDAWEVDN